MNTIKKYIIIPVLVFALVWGISLQTHSLDAALPVCSDLIDNNGDGLIDGADPECHFDGDATNPGSWDEFGTSEDNISFVGGAIGGEVSSGNVTGDIGGEVTGGGNGGGGGGGGGNGGGGGTTPVPQVLGVATGPVAQADCGEASGRPCSLLQTGGEEVSARTLLNRAANSIARTEQNQLVIPSLGINKPVLYFQPTDSLFQEAMILPWASTPDQGGNTVLVGHAYYARNGVYSKSTFMELDTMKPGEEIDFYWKGIKYTYVVSEVKAVTPDQIEIENQTDTPTLTIYSCGRFTNLIRTVVVAQIKI